MEEFWNFFEYFSKENTVRKFSKILNILPLFQGWDFEKIYTSSYKSAHRSWKTISDNFPSLSFPPCSRFDWITGSGIKWFPLLWFGLRLTPSFKNCVSKKNSEELWKKNSRIFCNFSRKKFWYFSFFFLEKQSCEKHSCEQFVRKLMFE